MDDQQLRTFIWNSVTNMENSPPPREYKILAKWGGNAYSLGIKKTISRKGDRLDLPSLPPTSHGIGRVAAKV